jgi:dTDP-4-amino-4,6-dideoxygalactose transaminase
MSVPAIGGVMAAARAGPPAPGNLLELWGDGWAHRRAYGAARSALAALLKARRVRRAWLPAYICPAVVEGVTAAGAEPCFYGVTSRLGAEMTDVARRAETGEAVIGVAFFGRELDASFWDLRRQRVDLLWIEDRAQAADGTAHRADATICSPRKLVGVADGGLLFTTTAAPEPTLPAAASFWGPEDARALDPTANAPASWYGLFQAREASVSAAPSAMSERSLAALEALPAAPVAEARRRNWRLLAARLADYALWPDLDPDFTPLAFPIVTPDAAESVLALAEERIWAPRHWPALPSPANRFPEAHTLSRRLVSVPCDQRYGEDDMSRVADAVLRLLQPQAR